MGTHQGLGGHEGKPLNNRAFVFILRQLLWLCIEISLGSRKGGLEIERGKTVAVVWCELEEV